MRKDLLIAVKALGFKRPTEQLFLNSQVLYGRYKQKLQNGGTPQIRSSMVTLVENILFFNKKNPDKKIKIEVPYTMCRSCFGTGQRFFLESVEVSCPSCDGKGEKKGKIHNVTCSYCMGSGNKKQMCYNKPTCDDCRGNGLRSVTFGSPVISKEMGAILLNK